MNLYLITRKLIFTAGWLFFQALSVHSQITISGHITDDKTNEPLIGAAIVVKSGTEGGITDAGGFFSFETKSPVPVTLSISYIGYKTREIEINDLKNPVNVSLAEEASKLDELVVIGYGTQKKKELTGSVASVSRSTLEQTSVSIDGLLGGAIPGVNVTQSSGQPGGGSSIRIRGGNSVYASNEPLYVIDGFIFYSERNAMKTGISGIDGSINPLASINPSDIESMEVLKDVSAKAIYGSRGANGVILVTTKKGKRGINNINYQYTTGMDKPSKRLDILNASQWARIQKDYFNNKGGYSDEQITAFGEGTNWQDAVLQTGTKEMHELSLSGGDEKTRYLLSGNYTDQHGIVLNSGFERYSGRINLDRILYKNLTAGITVTADKSIQNALTTFEGVNYNDSPFSHGIANSLTYALYMPPVIPVYNADGTYNYNNPFEYGYLSYYGQAANPVSDLKNSKGQTLSSSLLGNFYAKYTITEGLTAKINAGANVSNIVQNFYAPPFTALGLNQDIRGIGAIGNRSTGINQTEYLLTYNKQLDSSHTVDLLAGYTYQKTNTSFVVSKANHLETFDNLGKGKELPPISREQKGYLHSLLGRVNYTLLGRYNLTATYRADKSSRFASGYKWGIFPSIGFSWIVSDEEFFKSLIPVLSSLKLRANYGIAGNQEIDFDEYEAYFNAVRYNGETAYDMDVLGNDNLKWETTGEYNAGIDAEFLKGRLTLIFDVYSKETRNLLLKSPPPLGSPTTKLQTVNLGNVTNKGFEFSLQANLVEQKRITWSAGANIARNVNTITNMGRYHELTIGNDQEEILRTGESAGSFYGYVFDGVVQKDEDVSILPVTSSGTPKPGDAKFADLSGPDGIPDGKIDPVYDRKVIGSIQPDFTYGFSTKMVYHEFDLYVSLQGSQGNEVYNLLRRFLEGRPNNAYNMSSALLNSWTENNPSNTIPRINSARTTVSDSRFIEDASFMKVKNITVGYTLPLKIPTELSKLRIFITAQNALTFSRYKGYDPEVASGKDLGVYPSSRSFLAGLGLSF